MTMFMWQMDGTNLKDEILAAKKFYVNKFKVDPGVVFVHPTTLLNAFPAGEMPGTIHGLQVKAAVYVLKNALHIGVREDLVIDA